MKTFSIALTLLKKEYKKNISFAMILSFAIFINFIFTNIGTDVLLIEGDIAQGYGTWESVVLPLSFALPFVINCICWFMMGYASYYYLNKKTQEFALLFISGASSFDILKYVLYQILIILCFIFPISIILGIIGTKYVTLLIYHYLHLSDVTVTIPLSTFTATLVGTFMIFVWIAMITGGYLHRNTILNFLEQSYNVNTVKIKKGLFRNIIPICIYISALLIMIFQEYYLHGFIFPALLSMLAMTIIIRRTIPYFVQLWKKKKGIAKKYALISMSYYNSSLQGGAFLIIGMMILVTGMIPVLITQRMYTNEYITGVLCYFVIAGLLGICIIFKFSTHIQTRKNEFQALSKIGYIKNELKKIIRIEIIAFYMTIILLPLPIVIITGIEFMIYENLTLQLFIFLVVLYIIPIILSAWLSYHIYINEVIV